MIKFIFRPDVSLIKKSDFVFSSEETHFNKDQKVIMLFLAAFFILLFLPGLFTTAAASSPGSAPSATPRSASCSLSSPAS